VNGVDIRKFDAKQLTVDIQPPSFEVEYEWLEGAVQETEFETDVMMGSIKISLYFKGKSRNSILRMASEFVQHLTKSCTLELDGYKGKYKGYLMTSDYKKMRTKERHILNLEFAGYFFDDETSVIFDGVTSGIFHTLGTRKAPCIIEVTAKSTLSNYKISGIEDDIVIASLAAGKTLVIDGTKHQATIDGKNAFDVVDMWKFPVLRSGEKNIAFSNNRAIVMIRYEPMWM
jgi:Phage tail protein.